MALSRRSLARFSSCGVDPLGQLAGLSLRQKIQNLFGDLVAQVVALCVHQGHDAKSDLIFPYTTPPLLFLQYSTFSPVVQT